jgi:hypothetical protein
LQVAQPGEQRRVVVHDLGEPGAGRVVGDLRAPRLGLRVLVPGLTTLAQPVRRVTAGVAVAGPGQAERPVGSDARRRRSDVRRHLEYVEQPLERLRVPAGRTGAIVPEPEIVVLADMAVVPGDGQGPLAPLHPGDAMAGGRALRVARGSWWQRVRQLPSLRGRAIGGDLRHGTGLRPCERRTHCRQKKGI